MPAPSDPAPADPLAPLRGAPLLGLVGPTATGKTAVAVRLAERFGLEVVSVDSMQVYRGMDVGTAKPDAATRARARHHLLDRADPSERYDAQRYLRDVGLALADVAARGAQPLFVGGTGFYLKALTHGLFDGPAADLERRRAIAARARALGSPALHAELAGIDAEAARRIHPNDERRVVRALEVFEQTGRPLSEWQREWRDGAQDAAGRPRRLVGLALDADELDLRIERRTEAMLEGGWIEETVAILDAGGFGPTAETALGYREVASHVAGELGREELAALVCLRTRQFARRQRTWFRRFPDIRWIAAPAQGDDGGADLERAAEEAARLLGLVSRS